MAGNRSIGLNSVRSGCTTSFIPAEGIVTAPMLGHGCVCNYPMFASLGLYYSPGIEQYRPASVTNSWRNRADELLASLRKAAAAAPGFAGPKIETAKFHLINCIMENDGPGVVVSTKGNSSGYALRAVEAPMARGVFTFAVQRAPTPEKRSGNVFFVFGTSEKPDDWLECRLYYGGRRSMMITGKCVQEVEKKIELPAGVFQVTVAIDCQARTVDFAVNGAKLTSKITGPFGAISHYGLGGGNAANLLTSLSVRP